MGLKPTEKLSALAPLPQPAPGTQPPVDELERIMALPRRPPVDCEVDPLTGRLPPATQALVEFMTAKFSRGPRVTCACRPRVVTKVAPDLVSIARVLPPQVAPEPPKLVTVAALVADCGTHADEAATAQKIARLAVGGSLELPTADGDVGRRCIDTLNPQQSWTLYEAPIVGGIVGFKGVGSGKTISGLLMPLVFPDARLAVLCFESKQRRHYRHHYLRLREHMRVPSIVFDDDGPSLTPQPGTVPLHLISYAKLSRTENSDLLDERDPDVLILDEAHHACGDSAINRRVKRFVTKKIEQREARIAAGTKVRMRAVNLIDWSGTLENYGVQDTHMLCTYSLGTGSPLPLSPDVVVAWSAVMDASRRPDRESTTARRLHETFGDGLPETDSAVMAIAQAMVLEPERAVRQGFQRRRAETPGVITASASRVKSAIYFSERKMPKMPDAIRKALLGVRDDSKRPDGETLSDRLEIVSTAREVIAGFYSYWAFPKHKCSCVAEVKCAACAHIDRWYLLRKLYKKEERTKVQCGEAHLDSPDLCEEAAIRYWQQPPYHGSKPVWACESWPAWAEIKDTVEYEERVKWICDHALAGVKCTCDAVTHPGYYLARDAAQWARENKGVVWFKSRAFGRKVSELSGLPYFNGGPGCEERLMAEKGDRSIICSIRAIGAGTDGLQYKFWKQLIAEMPASNGGGEGVEQLLGRLHREGQPADAVETWAYLSATEYMDAYRQVLMQAEVHQDMQKLRQRILMADKDL